MNRKEIEMNELSEVYNAMHRAEEDDIELYYELQELYIEIESDPCYE